MIEGSPTVIGDRLQAVRMSVAQVAGQAGREPDQISVIAVSKGMPADAIRRAFAAGSRDFAENRVQELISKHNELPSSIRWHFVGRLQRNKVGKMLGPAPVIHSVDSGELAEEINRRATVPVEVLIEVNVSGEPQKGGITPKELPHLVEAILGMKRLDLTGLMTMAPRSEDPETARPLFRRLAELRFEVAERYSCPRIHHLSMGMSQDYRVAVEEGSTMVRIGEAIFGPRAPARSVGVLER